eukprot:7069812-Karenia_brevis.AAC.1
METIIFTSHPVMQDTLKTAVQKATLEVTQEFEARITKVIREAGSFRANAESSGAEAAPDTGGNTQES